MKNPIENLICFPDPECLGPESIQYYIDADWYEIDGTLLFCDYTTVPSEYLMDESDVNDVMTEEETAGASIQKIDDCLKRFDEVDGFYHV